MTPDESDEFFEESFRAVSIMTILRGLTADRTVESANRGWDAGVNLLEVPLQSTASADSLAAAVASGRERGVHVGAGTITSTELVERAASLGAVFTVAPGFDPVVAGRSLELGLPHLAGVATATEVQKAMQFGFHWLKAFPAAQLGQGWITAMHGPFPAARFVATGGIRAGTVADFLSAGAAAVSLGAVYEQLSPEELTALVREAHGGRS